MLLRWALTLFATAPSLVFASGGANISLEFTKTDRLYLYLSLGFGLLALVVGYLISKSVLSLSPGTEKMQEVGLAIREGALAYLKKQVIAMIPFVAILAFALYLLYLYSYGSSIATGIAVSFIGGTAASYIAGYIGMLIAVSGNMRTANAALTSYKKALETAFRSGAVSGLVTVGMGLFGATLIFLFAGNNALKLLIGFGFGGSLAALFMRVGGGIYTKAADVGADLVGKVEAGIPEDDPRNPATIADNVGDNVGDCAGMAADVFESYEVTLVASIVLAAATATIFDATTWMKLVLFALLAQGTGIIASIIGIFSMKGKEDLNIDPLKSIRKGFLTSAVFAAIGTFILSWFMLGGTPGSKIQTTELLPLAAYWKKDFESVKKVQDEIAKQKKIEPFEITVQDLTENPSIKKLGFDSPRWAGFLQQALTASLSQIPEIKNLEGFHKIEFDGTSKLLSYAVAQQEVQKVPRPKTEQNQGANLPEFEEKTITKYVDFKTAYKDAHFEILKLKITYTPPTPPVQPGQPVPPAPKPQVEEVLFGPLEKKNADKQLALFRERKMHVDVLSRNPVSIYANQAGEIALAADVSIEGIHRSQGVQANLSYYPETPEKIKALEASHKPLPQIKNAQVASVEHVVVEWWRFFACVVFGILMVFAIEKLTDYYVSTKRKPVQEVANVATAGAAPMLIQGFAFAKESSSYSVFAIVIALVMPLLLFPSTQFGGYILSFYGISLVGLGLLTTTGYILSMDTFGPISDNAQGIFEMSGAGQDGKDNRPAKIVQQLDAAGNTTKALTKGFAIATAVIAAVALFYSFIEDANLSQVGLSLAVPEIFLGLLIGGAAPYLFSAFSINAVGRSAMQLINEVRAQFKENPGIMQGTSKPDYARCVAIVTRAAQHELLAPGILAIALPILVGFGFGIGKPIVHVGNAQYVLAGAQALGGFLVGAILSGQLMAVLLANSGGIWDNAKKLIEDGLHGGKGTDAHKASVVCDTVGDPFKDTAGPALNPLIKVMNLIALLIAPVVILPLNLGIQISITLGALALLTYAILRSKKGSFSSEMTAAKAGSDSKSS